VRWTRLVVRSGAVVRAHCKAPPGFSGLAKRGRVERLRRSTETVGSTRAGSTVSKTDLVTRERSERGSPQATAAQSGRRLLAERWYERVWWSGLARLCARIARRRPDSAASRSEDALSGGSRFCLTRALRYMSCR
jgi:hypothetical protein